MLGRLKRLSWAAFAMTLVLLASCGGDSDTAASETTERETVTTEQQDPSQQQDTEDTGAVSTLPCDDPPPTEMAFETPIISQVEGFDECFRLEVPAGVASFTIELTGLTSPLNLVVGYDDVETIQYFIGELWQSREDGTADEIVTIEDPKSGTYYVNVAVGGSGNSSPFTLSASSTS